MAASVWPASVRSARTDCAPVGAFPVRDTAITRSRSANSWSANGMPMAPPEPRITFTGVWSTYASPITIDVMVRDPATG